MMKMYWRTMKTLKGPSKQWKMEMIQRVMKVSSIGHQILAMGMEWHCNSVGSQSDYSEEMGSVEENQDSHLDEHMWAPDEDDTANMVTYFFIDFKQHGCILHYLT